ncbi:hypothetical protein KH5H1_24170 [Corallococcus caeni]|uniref:Uncharacterized protein n=1 Tax=Corallococcus caeni TaxID=3082388 RepID=A0ABQ6QSB0_9BACT|nr:hypothetical protein KH5H1_24170 [Corallococcus sp. KH5-1]GMU06903.1 hypothetical protein ASNO1_31560 [Corallococcus sp. NO1]
MGTYSARYTDATAPTSSRRFKSSGPCRWPSSESPGTPGRAPGHASSFRWSPTQRLQPIAIPACHPGNGADPEWACNLRASCPGAASVLAATLQPPAGASDLPETNEGPL